MPNDEAPAHVIDSRMMRDQFGTPSMRAIFSDVATLRAWFDAEVALASAEAQCGLIPGEAADAIARAARTGQFDLDEIRRGILYTSHPLVPAVRMLEKAAGEAGRYVHWGATTQDIMDTGLVLQMRAGLDEIETLLARILAAAEALARRHAATPMAGRTHGQHAVPITFGLKMAVMVAEWRRHQDRLAALRPRLLVGQLSGAAGTLATLGEDARRVREAMMRHLGLGVPDVTWHPARDSIAEAVFILGLVAATCGKFATEVINLQRTEIAEVAEGSHEGSVGSSTMPQKRNPMVAEGVAAVARLLRPMPGLALDTMSHAHERDMAVWQAEWSFVPEAFILAAGCLSQAAWLLEALHVDPERMRFNLDVTGGLISAEAVMMRLANDIGREEAHEVVARASRRAVAEGRPFAEVLASDPAVSAHLDRSEIDRLLDPSSHLGESVATVERILARQ